MCGDWWDTYYNLLNGYALHGYVLVGYVWVGYVWNGYVWDMCDVLDMCGICVVDTFGMDMCGICVMCWICVGYVWCEIRQQSSEEPCDETSFGKKNVVLCTKSRAQMYSWFQNLHPSVQSKHESLADLLRMTLVPREYPSQSPFLPQQQPHQCPLGLLAKHRWMCKEAILESVRFVRGR